MLSAINQYIAILQKGDHSNQQFGDYECQSCIQTYPFALYSNLTLYALKHQNEYSPYCSLYIS